MPDVANAWNGGKQLFYKAGGGQPDSEGVTLTAGGSSAGVYVSTERDGTNPNVSKLSILRYDVSGATPNLTATNEWTFDNSQIPATGANAGLESIGWVPDSYLTAKGFKDASTGAAYNPASYPLHGNGIFFTGVESTGRIYGFALNSDNTFTKVADFPSSLYTLADLVFDPVNQVLMAVCDNNCNGTIVRLGVTGGVFAPVQTLARPTSMPNLNNEGFTVSPAAECVGGQRPVYWSDDANTDLGDGNGAHVLRQGTIDCTPPAVTPPPPPPVVTPPNCSVQAAVVAKTSTALTKANKALKKAKKAKKPKSAKAKAVKKAKAKVRKAKKAKTAAGTALATCQRG